MPRPAARPASTTCCAVWPTELAPSLAQAARYRHPFPGWPGRALQRLLDGTRWTALRRALSRVLPVPPLCSDVRDVIYMTWWVEAANAPTAPPGYRLFTHAGRTPYTVLTYRHGHFGPAFAGRLRALFPSPLQSNWRWYLLPEDDTAATPVVLFDCNVIDSVTHAAGAGISRLPGRGHRRVRRRPYRIDPHSPADHGVTGAAAAAGGPAALSAGGGHGGRSRRCALLPGAAGAVPGRVRTPGVTCFGGLS